METIYFVITHTNFFNNNLQATVSRLLKRRTKPKNESKKLKKNSDTKLTQNFAFNFTTQRSLQFHYSG